MRSLSYPCRIAAPALTALILLALGTGCSTANKEHAAMQEPLTPLPAEFVTVEDPGDEALTLAIKTYLEDKNAPAYTRYDYSRIDLDNDTRRDALVMMKTPYSYWCGLDGCNMAIFKAHNDGFTLVSEINAVRGPLVVSEDYTNGWRDLVVRASGRTHWEARTVAMKFDGRSYPTEPLSDSPMIVACNNPLTGSVLFP